MENKIVIICATVLMLAGCASTETQYYWGGYEELVYKTHHTQGEVHQGVKMGKYRQKMILLEQ